MKVCFVKNKCKLSYIVFGLYMQNAASQNDPGCAEADSDFTTSGKT